MDSTLKYDLEDLPVRFGSTPLGMTALIHRAKHHLNRNRSARQEL